MPRKDPTKYRLDLFPLAIKRADGKYLAEGVFFLSQRRLTMQNACSYGSRAAMQGMDLSIPVKHGQIDENHKVVIDAKAVHSFVKHESERLGWLACRLESKGDLTYEQKQMLNELFFWRWTTSYGNRDKVELIFSMLEVVARQRGLIA